MSLASTVSFVAAALCAVLAAAVLLRERRALVDWALSAALLAAGAETFLAGMATQAVGPGEFLAWQRLRAVATALLPGLWLLFTYNFARADHAQALRRWRAVLALVLAVPLALVLLFPEALYRGVGRSAPTVFALALGWAGQALNMLFLGGAVLVLRNLERTLRSSSGSMRWFVKFMILGIGCFFAARIYTVSQSLLYLVQDESLELVNSGALVVAVLLMGVSLVRSRLSDMDVYLSPAAIHGSLVVVTVGIYLLAVGVLARLVRSFGGVKALPLATFLVFLGLVGLTILLLSDELRQRTRRLIVRHLKRPRYDYREVWTSFTERTGSIVEPKELSRAICRFVGETLRVPAVTLWLSQNGEGLFLGGSTVYSEERAYTLVPHYAALLERLCDREGAADLVREGLKEGGGEPSQDVRHAIALRAGGEVLGLMVLGERGNREPLSLEDLDILRLLAEQAGAALLKVRLGARVLRAREMEAFQGLSAFFVHDLKNLASKLSLTLRNLPGHFDDPAFREDLLGVMSRSVDNINDMCARLSPLSRGLALQKSRTDLRDVVQEALSGLEPAVPVTIEKQLESLPGVEVDAEEMHKVVVNLVLNASEAVGEGGRIRIATERVGETACLLVSDNGRGMTPEFMARSLFQPFHTTKARGLGIGLYHSRKIVEAHGGRIEAESEPGKGSTFRVILPTQPGPAPAEARRSER